ncbi:MAG: tRNA 2-selenouridine(34) synthase MnmH [Pseudomonadota bacterium]
MKLLQEVVNDQRLLVDVRAPLEYAKGCLPNSTNLPILNDSERARVGTAFRRDGPEAAVALGHQLVSGNVRQQRIDLWLQATTDAARPDHAPPMVMCWRGGQRSRLAQEWLSAAGSDVARVPGGYKALRNACLRVLQHTADDKHWHILGGRTGVAKTVLIHQLPHSIDLEGRARHRGSAFGGHLDAQPSQASFENALAYDCLQHTHRNLVAEDESRTIGRVAIPEHWLTTMRQAPLILLEASLSQRVSHIYQEYIAEPLAAGQSPDHLRDHFLAALARISRRLGDVRHAKIATLLNNAFSQQDIDAHAAWIGSLLNEYYDPMYDYQLKKKSARIVFTGDFAAVRDYLNAL